MPFSKQNIDIGIQIGQTVIAKIKNRKAAALCKNESGVFNVNQTIPSQAC